VFFFFPLSLDFTRVLRIIDIVARTLSVWRYLRYLFVSVSNVGDEVVLVIIGIFRTYETSCAVKAVDTSCALSRELLFSQHRRTERLETPGVGRLSLLGGVFRSLVDVIR